ncbi:L-threonylcarbamoyladenylate synthase [Sphingomonas sp. KR1UV-12]|uniref:Threonylcarbamoyl-AMP synthase n=1 Tax=Sphingomonas aurea TaxID=3063994 RepID=A0ABT9EMI3_9SPHN|nr:L-threonylcarbamoyladenylate synthase [Sphingomonas sp. KR1UV-12]MDP1028146.1 L-threonylcarbamoyladenylate synthase [Sphingomonas sp. KR1UV-12]
MSAPNPIVRPYGTAAIEEAAAVIRAGGIVAVPTETVYGLAADAADAAAVARIYAAKGRPGFNPLIVHVGDLAAAEALAVFDAEARALATAFWPGPLTLVLPLRAEAPVASLVTAGLDTIAIRVPAGRAMRALIAASGQALAAPSANRSNGLSPTRAEHVVASLDAAAGLVIDDGPCAAGVESTIVRGRQVLRPGPVTAEAVAAVVGAAGPVDADGRIVAPGQLALHYAPAKPLRLEATARAGYEWLIGFGAVAGDDTLSAAGDLNEAAARLFDALHRADASGAAGIAVAPVPNEGVGAAINDRLQRAAAR